jgi:hypothetical protein
MQVRGDADLAVPQPLRDHLHVDVRAREKCGCRVPKVVEPDGRESGLSQQRAEGSNQEVAVAQRTTEGRGEDEILVLPGGSGPAAPRLGWLGVDEERGSPSGTA